MDFSSKKNIKEALKEKKENVKSKEFSNVQIGYLILSPVFAHFVVSCKFVSRSLVNILLKDNFSIYYFVP